jgi:hypothetical protein
MGQTRTPKMRRDGWTAERQLRFLVALMRARSVTRAAAFAGMTRESAYRLRCRSDGALFAALWDRAIEGHKVDGLARRASGKMGGNSPKVTKWKKWKDPGFEGLVDEFRDLPLTPPAAATEPCRGRSC